MANSYSSKSSPIKVTWSGDYQYTLTNSYVASDEIAVDFAKRFTLYPSYSAGAAEAGNTVEIQIQFNPWDHASDPTGAYWATIGNYIDTTGTWDQEVATWVLPQGVSEVFTPQLPISVSNMDALRMRVLVKETGSALEAGILLLTMVKNEIT